MVMAERSARFGSAMILSEASARAAVDNWLAENGRLFRYEHISTKLDSRGWIVVLAVLTSEGWEVDGPYVLVVDPATGTVMPSP